MKKIKTRTTSSFSEKITIDLETAYDDFRTAHEKKEPQQWIYENAPYVVIMYIPFKYFAEFIYDADSPDMVNSNGYAFKKAKILKYKDDILTYHLYDDHNKIAVKMNANVSDYEMLGNELTEKLVCVECGALRVGKSVYSLPLPNTYGDIVSYMVSHKIKGAVSAERGFILSNGEFVAPKTAIMYASRCGQIKNKHGRRNELYIEDLL